MTNAAEWVVVLYVGVGVGVLLVGVGVLIGMLGVAKTMRRVNATLDVVDAQVTAIAVPVGQTMERVEAIAEGAEGALGRLGGAAERLEQAAGAISSTTDLARDALKPAIVNVGAALAGVSAGLRRLLTGKTSNGSH